jgi:hypothetical protein
MRDTQEDALWDGRYLVTALNSSDELNNLAQLLTFAEAVYDRIWTGRKITPSA